MERKITFAQTRKTTYIGGMAKELTREENRKRAALGMREDRNDGLFQQHKHSYGLNSISFQGLDLGEPYKPSRDPDHDCLANGCRQGNHYIRLGK